MNCFTLPLEKRRGCGHDPRAHADRDVRRHSTVSWRVHYGFVFRTDVPHRNSSVPMPDTPTVLDASGLQCPMPLLKTKQALNALVGGERLRVVATDPGSVRDFEVFCAQSGHQLLECRQDGERYCYLLEKKR